MISKFLNFIFATFIFTMFLSCSNDDQIIVDNAIKVSTGDIYPEFNPDIKDYYITSLNTLNTIQVTLEDFTPEKTVYINDIKVTNNNTSIKLNIGEDLVVKYKSLDNEDIIYTIHYLPEDLPKINLITKNNPAEGYIFINLFELSQTNNSDKNYIAIIDNNGFPVYYKKLNNFIINFNCFKTNDNKMRYTYNDHTLGKIIVMNENFETIKELELLPNNGHNGYRTDNHDFIYFNDNHYILPAYVNRANVDMTSYGGSNSVELVDFVFQEIQNNQVIFEWNTTNFPEFLQNTDPIYYQQYATKPKVDYFHFNSISIDPNDNNFIVTARHMNQIYKIDRTNGQIIWRFGGNNDDFNLNGNEVISHPHHATVLNNGNLLLFDNGVTKNPQQSRIVEFELNDTNLTANLVNEYRDLGRYFDIMGSAQKLNNGNYFIDWGGNITSQVNANKSDITEIDSNGNIVLDISFTNNPNSFTYSYRALKYNISF